MNLREALLKAWIDQKPCFVINVDGEYSVLKVGMKASDKFVVAKYPKGAEYFVRPGKLPESLNTAAELTLQEMIKNAIFYPSKNRLPGNKIKRRQL